MFPSTFKANRTMSGKMRLLVTLAVAFALLIPVLASVNTAYAQDEAPMTEKTNSGTPVGEYCIEGLVIDWQEKPLEGWEITAEQDDGNAVTPLGPFYSAPEPEDDDDLNKGEFEITADDGLLQAPSTVTVKLTMPAAGWEEVTPAEIVVPLKSGLHDCLRVRFKVRPIIIVNVTKIDENHTPLADWQIEARPGPGNLFASVESEETDINGVATFTLTPGIWIFAERSPEMDMDSDDPMDRFSPVVPMNGKQEIDLKKQYDQDGNPTDEPNPYEIRFKNRRLTGCIEVTKEDSQWVGLAGWGIQVLRKDGSMAGNGFTDAAGKVRFDNLPKGPYIVVEETRSGWDTQASFDTLYEVVVDGYNDEQQAGCEVVNFANEQTDIGFCIEGYKLDANGHYGIPGWKITAEPLDKGGFEPEDAYTDGLGLYTFEFPLDDYRIPGSSYEICEDEVDGWLPHTPTCQVVTLPKHPMGCVPAKDFVNQQVGHSESQQMWGGSMGGGMSSGMSCSQTHMAKKGESLSSIGAKYGVPYGQMLMANPNIAKQPHQWVYVGQSVCIP